MNWSTTVHAGFGFCASRRMMIVLLLLQAAVLHCTGLSSDIHEVKKYGEKYIMLMSRRTHTIVFIPKYNSEVTVLWKEGGREGSMLRRRVKFGMSFVIKDLTLHDSGRYIMKDEYENELSSYTLEVEATTRTYTHKPGSRFRLSFYLKPNSCNIYFFPESNRELMIEIVRQGSRHRAVHETYCVGLELIQPCGVSNKNLEMSCQGRFEVRDQNNITALVTSLTMEPNTMTYERKRGDELTFTSELEQDSCNIYFFPESDGEPRESTIEIVRQGMLQEVVEEIDCTGFDLYGQCGISNYDLQMSCNGRFEVKDHNMDTVLEVSLEMEDIPYEPDNLAIGAGVSIAILICSCARLCCCRKSSSKEDGAETPDAAEPAAAEPVAAEPAVRYPQLQYDREPAGVRPAQLSRPSETHYPAPPSYTWTDPLIHNAPTVDMPPAYSEVTGPSEQAGAPAFPLSSDPEPRFELRGMTLPSAPPLSSDSTYCDVYNSSKLNFL